MSDKRELTLQERIDELLDVGVRGVPSGVFGREWCEACGKLGNFSGFISAMAAHRDWYRFVCGRCQDGNRARAGSAYTKPLDLLIVDRGFRYCGGCGRDVILVDTSPEELHRLPFTCPACQGLDRGRTARRRYLEHKATEQGGLKRAAARIYWAKAGVEDILANPGQDPTDSDHESESYSE